jgi:hypothetical protein
MESAVERDNRIGAGAGPWAELAELYCVKAFREQVRATAEGLRRRAFSLLREYRCAQRLGRTISCSLPNWRNEAAREWLPRDERYSVEKPNSTPWGFVPHPDLTPMCFRAFCGAGFQNDEDGEPRSANLNTVDEDAGDLTEIMSETWQNADARVAAAAERWCDFRSREAR